MEAPSADSVIFERVERVEVQQESVVLSFGTQNLR